MKSDLELRHLRVFAAVVDAGTHTRAARALGLSQSTVSETISALERTLGVELFRRATRGAPALTPSGEVLLEYAGRMFALSNELVAALASSSPEVRVTLVVSAVESIGAYVLPRKLAALRAHWPSARVEVLTGSCDEIRERVASGQSDLGLVLEPEGGPGSGENLAKSRLLLLAAPAHSRTSGITALRELGSCDLFMCDAGGNYHQTLRQHFLAAGVPAPRTHAMGTIEGVKRGVLESRTALGLLPEHAVGPELRDKVLAEVRLRPALPHVVLRGVLAPGAPRSPVIDDLIEALRDSLHGAPSAGAAGAAADVRAAVGGASPARPQFQQELKSRR